MRGRTVLAANQAALLHVWRAPSWAEIDAAEKAQAGADRRSVH